jgi:hypothetical protein
MMNYLTDGLSDWMVAGGSLPGNQSVLSFENILNNATLLDTGYIYHYLLMPAPKKLTTFF